MLRPYVADLVIDWLRETPDDTYREVEGTLAFVDISGFTALTERLARAGAVGAEEMSDILSAVFTDLLTVAFSYGAWVVKWGGDAVLLLFEGEEHPAMACRAAVEMRRVLRRAGQVRATAGSASLRMSVGVHSGPVSFFLVGTRHRELVITGPAATEVALMEAAADAGEIVLSSAAARLLDPRVLGETKGRETKGGEAKEPAWLLRAPPVVAEQRSRKRSDLAGLDLAGCLPGPIADYVLGGASEGEHRRVAVAFVEFSGTDELLAASGPQAVGAALHELVSLAQETCHRCDVTFLETDVSPGGGKIMMVAGAPHSEGHHEQRLLRAARAIVDYRGPLSVRAGANSGRVFAGDFGPPHRRTYSVKGDAVNLAARVMGRAGPGQLLATAALLDGSASAFTYTPLPAFRVKGKSKPVNAVEVGAAQQPPRRDEADVPPLVGREAEIRQLRTALDTALTGRGQVAEIAGPPGIGKSRLADELLAMADTRTLLVACDRYVAGTPYALIDALLRELVGVARGAGPKAVLAALADVVDRQATGLRPWLPLLAAVVGADLPPTPEVAALAGEFLRTRLELTVTELIGALLPVPAVLVVEDLQLIDDASASLLSRLLADVAARPWLVLFTCRESGTSPLTSAADVRLTLEPLGPRDAAALLSWETRSAPLLPHQLAAIAERSTGNPLFARELVRVASGADDAVLLPESIEDVVGAQVDRLAPADRDALRAAAVAGMRVDTGLLAEVLGRPPSAGLWDRLGAFVQPDQDGSLRFQHALVRDAAYEGLSFRRRRQLHDGLARALERRAGRTPDADAGLLSVHFYYAQNFTSAAHYARIAGEQAAVVYANAEAAGFLHRSLEAAKRKRQPAAEEIAHLAEAYADLRYRLGEFATAGRAYAAARKVLSQDPVGLARLRLKTALVVARTEGLSQALRWITRGRRILDGLADPQARRLDSRLLVQTAQIRQLQGRYAEAEQACEAAIAAAESAGARDVLAQALQFLDAADVARGRFDREPWAERSLVIWEELGELAWQARVLNQLGIRAYFEGRWGDALAYYRRAAETLDRVGDQWTAAIGACNVGEILSDQGRYAESDEVTLPALRVLQASGAHSDTAFALSVLGRTAARAGRLAEAYELLDATKAGYLRAGERGEALSTEVRIAECLALGGQTSAAQAATDEAAIQLAARGIAAEDVALDRLRGYLLAQQGQPEQATEAFEASLTLARKRSALYDQALSLDALIRLAAHCGLPPSHSHTASRTALFGQLGVIATAAFPLSAQAPGQQPGPVLSARKLRAHDARIPGRRQDRDHHGPGPGPVP
jgi:class 3 adenylate cyclase/tetratricopeptide (TPR) repeat protein